MYIKEITIDGFKSYAQRVTLPNFDPRFNAITGLNGSGKSNILDSICFVLGIKNLSQVRQLGGNAAAASSSKTTLQLLWPPSRNQCSSNSSSSVLHQQTPTNTRF